MQSLSLIFKTGNTMDYSQFLNMFDELTLLAVIVILFLADMFLCGTDKDCF